jgi:hypothetical protein
MESWISQGIITSTLATVLWAGGATLLTWIRNRWPTYGTLALYWVASAACLAVLWFATTGYVPFSTVPPRVTSENIEANMKQWSENLGLAFTKANIPDSYFAYTITTRSGTPIQVLRSQKEKPSYLQFVSTLMMAPEHQAIMGTLTKDQVDTVTQEIAIELDKTRVGFVIATVGLPQTGANSVGQTAIVLQRAGLITSLNESDFAAYVDDMEFAVQLTRAATTLAIKRMAGATKRAVTQSN